MIGTIVFALLLFLLACRGWQRGIVRQGLSLCALAVAVGVGYWAYQSCGLVTADFFRIPRVFGSGFIAVVLGLMVYLCITIPGAVLFKKTSQQTGIIRFFYGVGGALCGIAWGALLWGFFALPASPHVEKGGRWTLIPKAVFSLGKAPAHSTIGNAKVTTFEQSTNSLYETFHKVSRVVVNEHAMIRFLQYPDVRRVMETKAVSELMHTPEFAEAVSSRNVVGLLFHVKLYQTLKDPEVEQAIKRVHLNKALDYALGGW